MKSTLILSALSVAWTTAALPLQSSTAIEARDVSTFNNKILFTAGADYTAQGTLYARSTTLADGTILATWENYSPEPPQVYFPIYASTDSGVTWTERSRVEDTVRGYGLRYQPFLYPLPADFAGFKAGDILLSGSAIPSDLSTTHIELYVSRDQGYTWEFVSHIADGGRASTDNGQTPVWEPALLLFDNQLIAYYSDQRDPAHGQKLVHQVSSDGLTWGDVVNDVAYPTYTDRPGMITVAQLPNGDWIGTYEYGGGKVNGQDSSSYLFPVYYKIASDPRQFGSVEGVELLPNNAGALTSGSPYVVATKEGKIVVSSGGSTELYVNHFNTATNTVDPNGWVSHASGEGASYTRSLNLQVGQTADQFVLLLGGGSLSTTRNSVTAGVVDIQGW